MKIGNTFQHPYISFSQLVTKKQYDTKPIIVMTFPTLSIHYPEIYLLICASSIPVLSFLIFKKVLFG